MFRTVLILIATPVIIVIAAALLIPVFVDEDMLLGMASETLERETGAKLVVDGGASLSLFPKIAVELGDASLTLPGEQDAGVKLRALTIGLELMPLFSGQAKIGDIAIDGLRMTLQSAPEQAPRDTSKLSDEQLDKFYNQRRQAQETAGQAVGNEAVAALPLALNVERLLVRDSVLVMLSAGESESTVIRIDNLEATGLNLDGEAIPLSVKLSIDGAKGSAPMDIALDGAFSVNAESRLLTIKELEVEVSGALAKPARATISGEVDLSRQAAEIQLALTLGGGEIKGEGQLRYASFETPQIDAKMHFNKFDPALLALVGPDAAADEGEPSETNGDQALPLNAIRAIDTRATLSIDEVNIAGHIISKAKIKLRAVDGVVKLFPFTGTLHGGKIKVNTTLNAQHNPVKFFSKGELAGLVVSSALKTMGSDPIMSGTADLHWKLNSKGNTSNELIAAMNGPIDLLTNKLVLKSVGVEKILCEAVALTNGESLTAELADSTRFENLSVSLKMSKGKLLLKPLRAELPHMKLNGQGLLGVLDQDFTVTLTARLSPDLGDLDPACRVNKRIAGIGWPVKCKGKISGNPANWCAVDTEQIIQDLATREVEHQIEKQAGKFLDKLMKK